MRTFPLTIASPQGELFRDAVTKISLRGTLGELAVMAGHAPFVTAVKPCQCRIEMKDGQVKTGQTDGGLLTVTKENITLLLGQLTWDA